MTKIIAQFVTPRKVTLVGALLALSLGGCSGPGAMRVDGLTEDWSGETWITSDNEWVYVRIAPDAPQTTLQSSATPTRVYLDTDNNAKTGHPVSMIVRELGAEYEIVLSPPRDDGSAGMGSGVVDHTGEEAQEIGHAGAGFHFAPAFASGEYELRVNRELLGLNGGSISVGVQHGAWGRVGSAVLGARRETPSETITIPVRLPGTIRVMNWNVLWGSPMKNPEPFARVFRGLDADVLLLQEWDDTDDAQMGEWFETHAKMPNRRWQAVVNPDQGVAVVTRLPIIMRLNESVTVPGERDVRFVGAVLETGDGAVLVGSLHLKCCGSLGSREDLRRVRESEAISAYINGMSARLDVRTVIVGGDMNLVGSRTPLDTLSAGLDVDGSGMAVATPTVLGDGAMYTWRDAKSAFSPGRLDYLLVGDKNAQIRGSFVFDSATAGEEALRDAGIERGDSAATDHLAVVVDIQVCPDGCD